MPIRLQYETKYFQSVYNFLAVTLAWQVVAIGIVEYKASLL